MPFCAYATVYVIRRHQRVTLALHTIPCGEPRGATVTILLARLTALRVKIKRLYLDRGFYSVPVIRWLQALRIPFPHARYSATHYTRYSATHYIYGVSGEGDPAVIAHPLPQPLWH